MGQGKSLFQFKAKGNYTYTHSRNKSFETNSVDLVDKTPIYIPAHKTNFSISATYNKFQFRYSQLYNSKVFIDGSNSIYLPHYYPANFGVDYTFSISRINSKIGANINNLFDEPYQVVANRPIPGRNYNIYIKFNF